MDAVRRAVAPDVYIGIDPHARIFEQAQIHQNNEGAGKNEYRGEEDGLAARYAPSLEHPFVYAKAGVTEKTRKYEPRNDGQDEIGQHWLVLPRW